MGYIEKVAFILGYHKTIEKYAFMEGFSAVVDEFQKTAGVMSTSSTYGIKKEARISFRRLKAMLGKNKPLFHMTHNPSGIMSSGKVVTPIESQGLRTLGTIEGGYSTPRFSPSKEFIRFVSDLASEGRTVSADKILEAQKNMHMSFKDSARKIEYITNRIKQDMTRKGLLFELPGHASSPGRTATLNVNEILEGPGRAIDAKNMPTLWFNRRPEAAYGSVGVMTNPDKIDGTLLHGLRESVAGPKVVMRGDQVSSMILPQAQGTLVYDPKRVIEEYGIEMARKLKSMGAVPLNARFYRKLKALSRNLIDHGERYVEI